MIFITLLALKIKMLLFSFSHFIYYLCGMHDVNNNISKYTPSEELVNTITHVVGAVVTIGVLSYFLNIVYAHSNELAILSIWLYLFGVLSSYLVSAAYHVCPPWHVNVKQMLRKFDHAAIYWHIAACYTPVTLIAFIGGGAISWGWIIFLFVWLCAAVGTAFSFRKMSSHSYLETAFYLLMGLTIFIAFKPFYDCVGMKVIGWVIAEGCCYITGAVLYSIHKVRYMHSIFHLFVMLGDIFHMVAVWKILQIFVL